MNGESGEPLRNRLAAVPDVSRVLLLSKVQCCLMSGTRGWETCDAIASSYGDSWRRRGLAQYYINIVHNEKLACVAATQPATTRLCFLSLTFDTHDLRHRDSIVNSNTNSTLLGSQKCRVHLCWRLLANTSWSTFAHGVLCVRV